MARTLPLPDLFDPGNARRYAHRPDEVALPVEAARFAREHGVAPASADARRTVLLLIDVQRDFCFPEGSLYVGGRSGTGALDDSARLASFLYRNLEGITETVATLDTHHPFQIFFPSFWVDASGQPLSPHREVTADDVASGRAVPDPALAPHLAGGDHAWLVRQALHYCRELETAGKYRLYLWPPHCVLGSEGHTLAGVIQEARMFHAYARRIPARTELKGQNPLTENYSVLAPEVLTRHDGGRLDVRNQALVDHLLSADRVIVAGQAASHCVKSSVDDLVEEAARRDRALVRRIHVLADCMSAVAVPDPAGSGAFLADFTPQAEAALERWAERGVHVVRSTDEMAG
jgi:nicotinamidase-related amidase